MPPDPKQHEKGPVSPVHPPTTEKLTDGGRYQQRHRVVALLLRLLTLGQTDIVPWALTREIGELRGGKGGGGFQHHQTSPIKPSINSVTVQPLQRERWCPVVSDQ